MITFPFFSSSFKWYPIFSFDTKFSRYRWTPLLNWGSSFQNFRIFSQENLLTLFFIFSSAFKRKKLQNCSRLIRNYQSIKVSQVVLIMVFQVRYPKSEISNPYPFSYHMKQWESIRTCNFWKRRSFDIILCILQLLQFPFLNQK